MKSIERIKFFPDYCSTGIWVTAVGEDCMYNTDVETLKEEFGVDLPQGFVNKINAMNLAHDFFVDGCGLEDSRYKMRLDEGNIFTYMAHTISKDFIELFPHLENVVDMTDCKA